MPANSGNNQYFDFKGFVSPYTPPPLQQMLELAKANKQAEMDSGTLYDDVSVQDAVLPGPDTENQRAFEASLTNKANAIRERYMRQEIDPNQFKYEIGRLKAQKMNDLQARERLASYAQAAVGNATYSDLAKQGKIGPGESGINFLNTEWDSAKQGVFNPRPEAYTPYDFNNDWAGINQQRVADMEGKDLKIYEDELGNPYTMNRISPSAIQDRIAAGTTNLMTTSNGQRYVKYMQSLYPTTYGAMSMQEAARALQQQQAGRYENLDPERVPYIGDGNTSTRTPTEPKDPAKENLDLLFSGEAGVVAPYKYKLAGGTEDYYGGVGDVDNGLSGMQDAYTAPMAFKRTYAELKDRLVYDKASGSWFNKDGTPANPADVQAMGNAENSYRLTANNQREVYTQALHNIKSSGIRLDLVQDDILNQQVLSTDTEGYVDIDAENRRQAELSKRMKAVKTYKDALDQGRYPTSKELAYIGLGDPKDIPGFGAEAMRTALNGVTKESLVNKLPELDKTTYQATNPSPAGKAFRQEVENLMEKRYKDLVSGSQAAMTSLLSLGPGRKMETDMIQDALDHDKIAYSEYYDPSTGGRFFDDEGRTPTNWAWQTGSTKGAYAKDFQGLTVDPNTHETVAVTRIAPYKKVKGGKDEPDWAQSKRVYVRMPDFSDQILQKSYQGENINAIKNYAAQLSNTKSYGYSGRGVVELNDGTVVEIDAKRGENQINIKELDPYTGKPTGKWKSYNSLFDASADLAKGERLRSATNTISDALMYAVSGVESNHGANTENPYSNATGTYQFMWTDVAGPMIKNFAKKNGYGTITKEDFANDPELQARFAREEWFPTMYREVNTDAIKKMATAYNSNPWVIKNAKPRISSPGELVALNHLLGIGRLQAFLADPKNFKIDGVNMSPFEYLEKIRAGFNSYVSNQ